jgi:hypothetical protein
MRGLRIPDNPPRPGYRLRPGSGVLVGPWSYRIRRSARAQARRRCPTGRQSGDPLRLEIEVAGPGPSDWLFHSAVPAAHWWDDIVFT